ncbi:unnamed protein product, partial [Prorocentrum cordatum]
AEGPRWLSASPVRTAADYGRAEPAATPEGEFLAWVQSESRWQPLIDAFQGSQRYKPVVNGTVIRPHIERADFKRTLSMMRFKGDADAVFDLIVAGRQADGQAAERERPGADAHGSRDCMYLSDLRRYKDRQAPRAMELITGGGGAIELFVGALQRRRGTLLRGWRMDLDKSGLGKVAFGSFAAACRKYDLGEHCKGMWKSMCPTGGMLLFSELAPQESENIEAFVDAAGKTTGYDLGKAWEFIDACRWNSVSFDDFERGAQDMGFTGDCRLLFDGIEVEGTRRVTRDDLVYLENLSQNPALAARRKLKNNTGALTDLISWVQSEGGGAENFVAQLGQRKISLSELEAHLAARGFPFAAREAAIQGRASKSTGEHGGAAAPLAPAPATAEDAPEAPPPPGGPLARAGAAAAAPPGAPAPHPAAPEGLGRLAPRGAPAAATASRAPSPAGSEAADSLGPRGAASPSGAASSGAASPSGAAKRADPAGILHSASTHSTLTRKRRRLRHAVVRILRLLFLWMPVLNVALILAFGAALSLTQERHFIKSCNVMAAAITGGAIVDGEPIQRLDSVLSKAMASVMAAFGISVFGFVIAALKHSVMCPVMEALGHSRGSHSARGAAVWMVVFTISTGLAHLVIALALMWPVAVLEGWKLKEALKMTIVIATGGGKTLSKTLLRLLGCFCVFIPAALLFAMGFVALADMACTGWISSDCFWSALPNVSSGAATVYTGPQPPKEGLWLYVQTVTSSMGFFVLSVALFISEDIFDVIWKQTGVSLRRPGHPRSRLPALGPARRGARVGRGLAPRGRLLVVRLGAAGRGAVHGRRRLHRARQQARRHARRRGQHCAVGAVGGAHGAPAIEPVMDLLGMSLPRLGEIELDLFGASGDEGPPARERSESSGLSWASTGSSDESEETSSSRSSRGDEGGLAQRPSASSAR